jgi:hypothetical protein
LVKNLLGSIKDVTSEIRERTEKPIPINACAGSEMDISFYIYELQIKHGYFTYRHMENL